MANGVIEEDKVRRSGVTGPVTKDPSRAEIYYEIQAVSHPVLPSNAIVTYLDEGAANIVYSLSIPPPLIEPASSYRNAFPKTHSEREGFTFWDGKPPFQSAIHISFSSDQYSNLSSHV